MPKFSIQYPLYYGELAEHRMNSRGTLTIRLRIEYADMRKALLAGMKPPSESVVSVARKIDYRTGLYTVQGVHDDLKFSVATLTGYVEEMQSCIPVIYLLKDALMNVRRDPWNLTCGLIVPLSHSHFHCIRFGSGEDIFLSLYAEKLTTSHCTP